MNKPNLFIIGAPKCGTTSLYTYLESHPEVYAPDFKELRFFCDDLKVDRIDSLEAYLSAFREGEASARYLLDASPVYLASKTAIQNIYNFNPDSRLIAMLRHPADLFLSLHAQRLYGFSENMPDAQIAWALQKERAAGRSIPKTCQDPYALQYKERCSLGTQMERVFSIFPREQVLVVSLDELKADPKALYEKVLAFLELESDGRTDFPKENSSKTHRIRPLGRFLISRRTEFFTLTNSTLKNRSPLKSAALKICRTAGSALRRWNTVPHRRPAPRPEFIKQLITEFQPEVDKVKELTGIELKSSLLK